MAQNERCEVVIIGAGIGGLASALCLARAGLRAKVLERRDSPSEAGAGIQIGPNGMAVLATLGLTENLRPFAGVPRAIAAHQGSNDRVIGELQLGDWIEKRHGSPYWVIHRVDLHRVLFEAAQASPLVSIEMNAIVSRIEPNGGDDADVVAHTQSGDAFHGRALIGADGIWSRSRAHILGQAVDTVTPTFSGKSAARVVIPMASVPASIAKDVVSVWMREDAHLVCYPIRGGEEMAVVAIVTDQTAREGWGAPVDVDWVRERMADFGPNARALICAGEDWGVRGLHTFPRLPTWVRGHVALLGDAAHPILPFLAQGAVMALEDAFVLAQKLAEAHTDSGLPAPAVSNALQSYQTVRRPRVFRVQDRSKRQGEIFHMSGIMAHARNLSLRIAPPKQLMANYDWLYCWRP